MNEKRLKTRLRRAMVEALRLSSDDVTFKRYLASWSETDAGVKTALSHKNLVEELATEMVQILESMRAKAPAQDSAKVKSISEAKRIRQEPGPERVDRSNRS